MDFSHYSDQSVQMAVDLVNTATGDDGLADVASLQAFLAPYEDEWVELSDHCAELTERDLVEVREVRRRLRSVFEAPDQEAAAATLNELLADTRATPRISLHGDGPHLHFEPSRGRVAEWLGAASAMGLGVVLCDHGLERFGTCAAGDCDDAFVDTSRNRSRRHCSTSCTTRENVAEFRRRQKAAETA